MHRLVERSVALWKAQNGHFRYKIGKHLTSATPVAPFYIDYTERRCDYI
ncbi:MAG: hypothetical protein AAFY34_11045 [Pseudomonadota bacterium]